MNSDELFLGRVLAWSDGTPWFNLHYTDEKKFWQARAYKDLPEMLKGLAWVKKQSYVRNIYCCMSSQTVSTQKSAANGFTYYKGERSKEGALELKSLFLDIDVKKGAYADTTGAAAGLNAFMKATGMPRPTLAVETGGGGVHVHWVLDRALKVAEWLVLANALENATRQQGLITDEGVTADAARILRIPDTINWKYDHKPIATLGPGVLATDYPVAMIEKVLLPYSKPIPQSQQTQPLPGGATVHPIVPSINSDLTGGMAHDGTFVFDEYEDAVKFLLEHGAFDRGKYENLRDFLFATAWAAIAYPILADKLEQLFKETSAAVPDRDPAIADTRWTYEIGRIQKRMTAGESLIKPATIFKMALDLGWTKPKPAAPPGSATNDLPPGYHRQPDGTIWGSHEDKKTGISIPHQVSPYPMDQAWLSDEPALNFVTVVKKQPKVVHLLTKDVARKDAMVGMLAQQGFMIPPKNKTDTVQEFLVAWITQLQTLNRSSHAPAFGWAPGGGFAYNGKVYGTTGHSGRPDDVIGKHYDPVGDIQPWMDVSRRIISEQRHDLNAVIASAFAGPLVKFTGQEGLLMSACSQESGIGKSVALKIAASVWGHPINSAQTLDDTQNSVVRKLGEVRHLPVYWDEIKSEDQAEKFVNIAFMLSGGREKSRLTQTAASRSFGSWETMLIACSNDSIAETIASSQKSSTAGALRLFEFRVTPPPQDPPDVSAVSTMVNALKDNFGHAGMVYADYLGNNRDAIEKLVQTTNARMMAKWAVPAEERFWAAVVTTLYLGAHLANDLGLTAIDVDGLLVFLRGQWVAMRTSSSTTDSDLRNVDNLSNVLGRFLRDMRVSYTLHTDMIWAGRGRPKNGDVKVIQNTNTLREVKVQIGKQDRQLRVAAADLGEWMKRQKLSSQAFNLYFAKQFKMTLTTARLASGTDYATAQMKCYDFDLSDPTMDGFFAGIDLS